MSRGQIILLSVPYNKGLPLHPGSVPACVLGKLAGHCVRDKGTTMPSEGGDEGSEGAEQKVWGCNVTP